jgi:hypothetical protein
MGGWISLSYRTNFGNVFLYDSRLRRASQHCGLLSPCNKIVLGVVLPGNHTCKFLKNSTQLLDRLLLCAYYSTVGNICQLLLCLLAVLPFPEQLSSFPTSL